jgi:hypothetical protein
MWENALFWHLAKLKPLRVRIVLNGTTLELVKKSKYLGVIVQSDLTFNKHIETEIGKSKKVRHD